MTTYADQVLSSVRQELRRRSRGVLAPRASLSSRQDGFWIEIRFENSNSDRTYGWAHPITVGAEPVLAQSPTNAALDLLYEFEDEVNSELKPEEFRDDGSVIWLDT